jgi:hypothetical protein
MEQIVGRRIFAADGVAPCLAQESGPQSHRNDPGHPSRRSTWHTIGLYRNFAHRDLETFSLKSKDQAPPIHRNAKCRRRPGFGPTVSPKSSGSSDQGETRGARLGSIATSPIMTLKSKDQLPPIHETRSAEGVQDSGPQYRRRSSGPSDQGGTRGARLGSIATSPIVTLKSKDQLPPIHETRSAKAPLGAAHGHSTGSYGKGTKQMRDMEPMRSRKKDRGRQF